MKQDERVELDNLQTLKISEAVSYQYRTKNGQNYSEGLTASGRFYPCVKVDERFYFGIHRNEKFVPGIIWNQQFIPGILTKRGFFPGIATDSGFQFGVIAFGAFIPGIVVGNNFVPGLVRDNHFIPGCYTSQGDFALGRVFRRSFDSGVIESGTRNFISTDHEVIRTKDAFSLVKEGFGISNVRRYEAIGGIPIAGVVKGVFDEDVCINSSGIMTSKWMIIGGLSYKTQGDGISFDKEYLPHADQLSEFIEALGIHTSGLSDVGWASTQDEWEDLANGLTEGTPGNSFGGSANDLQGGLVAALDALGKGSNELIDGLNSDYGEFWANVVEGIKASGGVIGISNPSGQAAKWVVLTVGSSLIGKLIDKVFADTNKPTQKDNVNDGAGGSDGCGGAEGAGGGPPSPPDDGSFATNVSNGDDGGVNEGDVLIGGWKGMRPIEVKDPSKKASGVKVVQTDTGVIMVVDYDQMRDAMASGPEEGISIGFSPLTGETINVIPGAVDPKARFGKLLKQWYLNPKVNPKR